MRNKFLALALVLTMTAAFVGCGNNEAQVQETVAVETVEEATEEAVQDEQEATDEVSEVSTEGIGLEDGVYQVDFTTDSGMFHVNEAMDGHGELTVENGQATVHISLVSKKIVNLYVGLAADAEGDEEIGFSQLRMRSHTMMELQM